MRVPSRQSSSNVLTPSSDKERPVDGYINCLLRNHNLILELLQPLHVLLIILPRHGSNLSAFISRQSSDDDARNSKQHVKLYKKG
ncbi:hypothetical protein HBI56_086870 [Parastagonospora nodorum]|nr:hypothetical protein HBH52_097940 [Parastagonospora nodorum]KAH3999822.1 hypothetical protein HBI10_115590 [Parastagonospora nodorum]KAH4013241.1 hypothetical protein HBI13_181640 [Parastagonospora nodorum]KAH4035308.1 hypothetical protein HBI09_098030 [Parastagonospora nodorum]KAH4064128.1 hypothetical protein HBH50_182860 [Parastagonospora nodorum]